MVTVAPASWSPAHRRSSLDDYIHPMRQPPGRDVDVDVIVVGAGISGIDTAWRLQQRRPDTTYLILEARKQMGGTWDLFTYPGIRSDSDIATFAFPFRPWPGRQALADGPAIKAYVEQTAREAGITEHIRFGMTVTQAHWSSAEQRWSITAQTPDGPQTLSCAFLQVAAGYYDYNAGYLPDYPAARTSPAPSCTPSTGRRTWT